MEVWAIGVYNEDEPMGYDAIEMFAEALDLNLPVLADNGNASHQYPLDQAFPSAAFPPLPAPPDATEKGTAKAAIEIVHRDLART